MSGKLVCFMYNSDKTLLAKVYNEGNDYQIIVRRESDEKKVAERWCSRYKPFCLSQTRAMEIVEEIFKEEDKQTKESSFINGGIVHTTGDGIILV